MRPTALLHSRPDLLLLRTGLVALLGAVMACVPAPETEAAPRSTLFIGVDISGSFENDGRYDDAMAFAAHYIDGHLNGRAGLERPRALFVGAIGGEEPGQPQSFHPIHDFEGKTVAEIEADLREWFRPDDRLTDFNAFFRRAATLVQRQNLALAPITLVLLSDGVPDMGHRASDDDPAERYRAIDLDPLEYLARNVTVRLLYPEPTVAVLWEREVVRSRVRMWTVDATVMEGWRAQLAFEPPPSEAAAEATAAATTDSATGPADPPVTAASVLPTAATAPDADTAESAPAEAESPPSQRDAAPPAEPRLAADQPALWRWIHDNVDFRVRRSVF